MIIQLNNTAFSSLAKPAPAIKHILEKLTLLLMPLPLFMLFTGTEGIIKHESPENLASLGSIGSGFFNFINMHTLIIFGALGITFIVWFITRKIWTYSEEDFYENESQYEESEEPSVDQKINTSIS